MRTDDRNTLRDMTHGGLSLHIRVKADLIDTIPPRTERELEAAVVDYVGVDYPSR